MAAPEVVPFNDYLPAGATLHEGNFVIESLLAAGSFGATYVARDCILHRPVVIKEYFPEGCRRSDEEVIPYNIQNPEDFANARDRFLEEARVLAQFHHPGIVSVYNFFEANNTAYMVMEYLHGPTLLEILTERGFFTPAEVINIARQVCDALKIVHHAGMLHRDIKPSNIIWCDDGRVVLVDFGLSEKYDDGNSRHTRPLDTALRFGTPGYAPLEQYTHSAQLGPSSDIYALGATLYHLCSGKMPAPATDRACGVELAPMHCSHPVLSASFLWAMLPEIKKRPASIEEFLERINQADAVLLARKQLLDIFQKRSLQLAAAPPLVTHHEVAHTEIVHPEPTDDTGCMKILFIGYMIFGIFAAVVGMIYFFVRYVLIGG
jgi:serine/threonine-protein kinase